MTLPLSILDQSPIPAAGNAGDAVRNSVDLAVRGERLGFKRIWFAEHHASPALAGVSPEVLIGAAAQATDRIRLGSGGVMLPHYSPFKVAETFSLLAAMAPDRIDLGLGRAPGSDRRTAYALQRDRSRVIQATDFPDMLDELIGYLEGTIAPDHAFAALAETLPAGGGTVAPWLLGSSPDSALWAAERGLPYCIADFINSDAAPLANLYRRNFRPSARLAEPKLVVAAWAIAAENKEAAQHLANPSRMMFAALFQGRLIPVPSFAEAADWALANPPAERRRRSILGSGDEVRAEIELLAAEYDADEVMLVNILPEHAPRVDSYDRVARAFGLSSADSSAGRGGSEMRGAVAA
ncbi:luciferase family oxidoreductase group 1 [Sphingomonas jejuensis]|uniref:Luciferase family oxidoreductase group 1 n=1 Tax=Sphingomonas jejuensis TaxID=904715 RepID=A0ABX0XQ26_9SPHN|nr:LLM class flavin-dependent oxidoreductase [Sphingomonas jejuensis]NJC34775.1 luciferase family oxidoreductase group 1 [Sphingomonas jejuensis]